MVVDKLTDTVLTGHGASPVLFSSKYAAKDAAHRKGLDEFTVLPEAEAKALGKIK